VAVLVCVCISLNSRIPTPEIHQSYKLLLTCAHVLLLPLLLLPPAEPPVEPPAVGSHAAC
jgi:hypothetical protein